MKIMEYDTMQRLKRVLNNMFPGNIAWMWLIKLAAVIVLWRALYMVNIIIINHKRLLILLLQRLLVRCLKKVMQQANLLTMSLNVLRTNEKYRKYNKYYKKTRR